MRTSLPALALLTVLSAATLTGCSVGVVAGDGDGGKAAASTQSVADACKIASTSMADVQSDMSDSLSGLGTGDVSGAADAMTKLGDKLGEAEGNVTNAKVKAALATMGDDVTKFAELLAKAKDGGVQALAGDATEIQSLATDIQAAGKKISDLCS